MPTHLYIDIETFSPVPITNGVHNYVEGVEVMLYAYAFDDGPVRVLDFTAGDPIPVDLIEAIQYDLDCTVVAHNSAFERTVLTRALPLLWAPLERVHDTMVQAYAHALPGALGDLCEALGMPADKAKDRDGHRLIHLFCKPRADGGRNTRETHPAEWARFVRYCAQDVEAMREAHRRMPRWNMTNWEREIWLVDQAINDRGVSIDLELCREALRAVTEEQARLKKRTRNITVGELDSTTQRDAMLRVLAEEYGVDSKDLRKATLERLIESSDMPAEARELMQLRLQASSSSTAKYKKMLQCTCADGRARGLLQYGGAQRTLRWSGRMIQPQNFPRPTMEPYTVEVGIRAIKAHLEDDLFTGQVMPLAASALRGAFVAADGKQLLVADLSNIEGRVAAWLAGEAWKVQAFRDFDAGLGADLYVIAYARAMNRAWDEVGKVERQIGKVMELALQYAGGAKAFAAFADVYRLDLDELEARATETIPTGVMNEARGLRDWLKKKRAKLGLPEPIWLVCDSLKRLWRGAHPGIVGYWDELETAAIAAVTNPGSKHAAGACVFSRSGAWLRIKLPSGRCLCYPGIQFEKGTLSYMGVNQYTRKWCRIKTFSGKLFENIVQAISRDILAHGMLLAEQRGLAPVLSIHDELICEAEPHRGLHELVECMTDLPRWAEGLPLAAAGFVTTRYRKG